MRFDQSKLFVAPRRKRDIKANAHLPREHFALGSKCGSCNIVPRSTSKSMNSREDFIDFDLKRLI